MSQQLWGLYQFLYILEIYMQIKLDIYIEIIAIYITMFDYIAVIKISICCKNFVENKNLVI